MLYLYRGSVKLVDREIDESDYGEWNEAQRDGERRMENKGDDHGCTGLLRIVAVMIVWLRHR